MPDAPLVVHFKDNRTLAGYGDDFHERDTEVLVREASSDERTTVNLHQVKVVCFVRNLFSAGVVRNREAPPIHHESRGHRVDIEFKDGEKLSGTVRVSGRPTSGFFLTPLNPNANSIRIFVNPSEVVSFKFVAGDPSSPPLP